MCKRTDFARPAERRNPVPTSPFLFGVLLCAVITTAQIEASIGTDENLERLIENHRSSEAVAQAHSWLVDDPLALIPKIRGAQALVDLGFNHSANYYLSKISASDWVKRGSEKLVRIYFEVYSRLTEKLPPGELVEIPGGLIRSLQGRRNTPAIAFGLGFAAYSQNRYAQAEESLAQVPATSPFWSRAARLRIAMSVKRRSYPNAMAIANKGMEEDFVLTKARLAYAMKDYRTAANHYQSLKKGTPENLREWAWTLIAMGKEREAAQLLATNESPDIDTLILMARLSLRSGDLATARALSTRADQQIASDPGVASSPTTAAIEDFTQERAAIGKLDGAAFQFLRNQLTQLDSKFNDRLAGERQKLGLASRQLREQKLVENRLLLSEAVIPPGPEAQGSGEYAAAVNEALRLIEEVSALSKESNPEIEMRRAELLWKSSRLSGDTSQNNRERAIQVSERIYRTFPKFRSFNHNLFFLALANIQVGREPFGYQLLGEFIRNAPKDPRTADAYRLRGDIEFDGKRYSDAERSYSQILTFPRATAVGYAQYKLGWTNYHLGRPEKALRWFEEALVWCDRWEKSEESIALERESRRDLISVFAETGSGKNAPLYFEKFLRGESKGWILDLAKLLDGQGKYEKAAELYRYLIRKDPNSVDNLVFLSAVVRGEAKLHNWDRALSSAEEITRTFGQILQTPPDEKTKPEDSTAALVESVLRESTVSWHAEVATSDKTVPMLETFTANYLRAFRKWSQIEPVYLLQAQYLVRRQRYRESVIYFRDYWERFNASLSPEKKEQALRGYIQSLEGLEPQVDKLKIGSRSPSAVSQELEQRVALYQELFPSSPHIRKISYLGAYSLLAHGDMDKGIEACQRVFDFNPADEQGRACFDNLRSAAYERKNWKGTFQWAGQIFDRKFPGIEIYHPQLTTIRSESLLKWAEGERDDEAAGEIYFSATKYRELRGIWEKALFNSFARYNRAGNFVKAIQAGDRLEAEYPGTSYLPVVAAARAGIYQKTGDYRRSYQQLVIFLRKEKRPDPISYSQGLLNAGTLAFALDKKEEAKYWLALYGRDGSASPGGRALARGLEAKLATGRGLASIPNEKWDRLSNEKQGFETSPIDANGPLPQRIKGSAAKLERLAREFLDLSGAQTFEGNESLCALAVLYSSFERGLRDLALTSGENSPQILQLAAPLNEKSKEFATDCLKRAADTEHDGPYFRQVNAKWGWEWDPILSQRTLQLVRDLGTHFPQLDRIDINRDEETLLNMHLQKVATPESWYTLVRIRCEKGPSPLCRQTLSDAITVFPTSGKLLNATAIYFGKESRELPSSLFARAADQGSSVAIPNLAFYHLKEGRLAPGLSVLKKAYYEKYFQFDQELNNTIETWVEK